MRVLTQQLLWHGKDVAWRQAPHRWRDRLGHLLLLPDVTRTVQCALSAGVGKCKANGAMQVQRSMTRCAHRPAQRRHRVVASESFDALLCSPCLSSCPAMGKISNWVALLACLLLAWSAAGLQDGLARTPMMGFNT